jgi:hypothetical protein
MWDAGSWEETMAVHASSVGIVVKLLERFKATGGFPDVPIPDDVARINEKTMRELDRVLDKGYALLNAQLFGARLTESVTGQPFSQHFEDSALFHLTWGFPQRFSLADREKILAGLEVLKRPSGYIRYDGDLFLYGAAEAAKNRPKVPFYRFQAVIRDGKYRLAVEQEIKNLVELHDLHMKDKNSEPFVEVAGRGLEAQWTFFDSMAGVENARLFEETGDLKFRDSAIEHFRRLAGFATGFDMLTTEGTAVEPYRFPEAYVPVRVLVRGVPQIAYVVSPNSPLNWSTAEAAILALKMWEITE